MSTPCSHIASSIALATLIVHLLGTAPAQAEKVYCAGGETGNTLMEHLMPAFNKHSGLDVESSGIGNREGLVLLSKGLVEFAFTCRPHQELIKGAGLDPAVAENWASVAVAYHPFVVVTNPANGVGELTIEQLTGLFSGRYTRWTDLGGADFPVVPVILNQALDCGVGAAFLEMTAGPDGAMSSAAKLMHSADQLGHFTRATVGAVTFMGFNSFDPAYGELLPIAGVAPNWDSVIAERYPLSSTVQVIFDQDAGSCGQEFLDFLGTMEGTALINQVMIAVPLGETVLP